MDTKQQLQFVNNNNSKQEQRNANANVNGLVHPIPQRRYAFIFPNSQDFDGSKSSSRSPMYTNSNSNSNNNNNGVNDLIRPVSAPAGFHQNHPNDSFNHLIERPSSPLLRVANPMVRDYHFRRGIAAGATTSTNFSSPHHSHNVQHANSNPMKTNPIPIQVPSSSSTNRTD